MAWVFSKRCRKALREGKIKVSIPRSVRIRILKLFERFNEEWVESTDRGVRYWTSRIDQILEEIKAEHGLDCLFAYPEKETGPAEPSDFEGFILRGNYPPYLLDTIELYHDSLPQDEQIAFQKEFNQIMEESELPWRMLDGKVIPVDSHYIEEMVLKKAYELLKEVKFEGALVEFEQARRDLISGDYNGAIQNANHAVESVCKSILNVDKKKPGELYRMIIDSGLIPEYYEGFLKAFEENILRCVAIPRNEEPGVGHWSGCQNKRNSS